MADDIFADLAGLPVKKSNSPPGPAFNGDAVLPSEHSNEGLKPGASLTGMPMVSGLC